MEYVQRWVLHQIHLIVYALNFSKLMLRLVAGTWRMSTGPTCQRCKRSRINTTALSTSLWSGRAHDWICPAVMNTFTSACRLSLWPIFVFLNFASGCQVISLQNKFGKRRWTSFYHRHSYFFESNGNVTWHITPASTIFLPTMLLLKAWYTRFLNCVEHNFGQDSSWKAQDISTGDKR